MSKFEKVDIEIPLVSVSCVAYNHEKYIRLCLDSFLEQKTTFPIEIIIHDDASSDNTRKIIEEYVSNYPKLIFPVYRMENQYSKGIHPRWKFNSPRWRGKYVALCEGDDHWTDVNKLQRQFDFLEQNKDYVAIAENAVVENSINNTATLFSNEVDRDVNIEELVKKRRFATASVMFRKDAVSNILNEANYVYDTLLWCYLCKQGKFRYSSIVSSVYNRGIQGVVVSTDVFRWAKNIEKWNLDLIKLFAPVYFNPRFAEEHIWTHYWKAYEKLLNQHRYSEALKSLAKCFNYNFTRTIVHQFGLMYNGVRGLFRQNE